MPNWCNNTLTVTGNNEDIKTFLEQVKSDEMPFDFNSIKPMPKEFDDICVGCTTIDGKRYKLWRKNSDGENEPVSTEEIEELEEKYGASNAIEWAKENWGTKWNLDAETEIIHISELAEFIFDTAWTPPIKVIDALSTQHPNLTFALRYEEPGNDIRGTMFWEEKFFQKHS